MARMGGRRHMKALAAPRSWKIRRKENVFVAKPKPGPHPMYLSLPAYVLVRDVMGETASRKEAKTIFKQGKVLIDGRETREEKRPVGLMDVVSFPSTGKHYRVTVDNGGHLTAVSIPAKESKVKVGRVMSKFTTKKGELTIRLHDGTSLKVPGEVPVDNGDSIVLSLPDRKLSDVIRVKEGTICFAFRGSSAGKVGKYESESPASLKRRALANLKLNDGSSLSTLKEYVMAIGSEEPRVTIA
ncbi:MAG TPA: 30S ribosomal protein S4e [Thermoproteota archaeon]|nr:30S ribosomal protein S4e [Thermoproteota archaeon]